MAHVRVHAPVRDEPEQVHVLAALERGDERRVLEERAILDRLVHVHQVLVGHASGADRQMSDLRVPHLPGRKADRLAGSGEGRVRVLSPEAVEGRRVGELDGVSRPRRSEAPAVQDDEGYKREAARQIAPNDSTSSEAPPTSAPSTAGSARISAAFSGLTEPP